MVSVKGLVTKKENNTTQQGGNNLLQTMISTASVQERFEKMLGKKTNAFLSSLLTLTNQSKALQKCDPRTILSAASIAASLDLPVNPNLGFCWVIGYGTTATFQLGYKGLIQLAQRSGLMKSIICTEVYEGEIKNFNRFTETFEVGERTSDVIVGYYASFELVNGFKKCVYWSHDDVIKHAKKFSKSFGSGPWQSDTTAMCKKVTLSSLLRTFAPLSTEMQMGISAEDQKVVVNDNGETEFMDIEAETVQTEDGKTVDVETGEIIFDADDVEEAVQG